jgi:hypothetical protein
VDGVLIEVRSLCCVTLWTTGPRLVALLIPGGGQREVVPKQFVSAVDETDLQSRLQNDGRLSKSARGHMSLVLRRSILPSSYASEETAMTLREIGNHI